MRLGCIACTTVSHVCVSILGSPFSVLSSFFIAFAQTVRSTETGFRCVIHSAYTLSLFVWCGLQLLTNGKLLPTITVL